MKTKLGSVGALLICGVFVAACNSKTEECNRVAEIVNANVDVMQNIEKGLRTSNDPAEEGKQAQAMVDAVQQAAQKLSALEIKTDGLKGLVANYVDMLKKIEEGGREIVTQVEAAGDLSEAKLDATLKKLEAAQQGIMSACEKPSKDCMQIAAVLEKLATEENVEGLAATFAKVSDELEKVELADGALKTATAELGTVVKEKVALLDKALQLQKGLEAAEKKIDEAVAKESKVVDELNGFCGAS